MAKKVVFIVGMHRSGTSLIAKAVQVLGASLGDRLMDPAPDNPTGFWEDRDTFELNQQVLGKVDMAWDFPTVFPLDDKDQARLRAFEVKMERLLVRKTVENDIFALKDPRLCLLLPLWIEAAEKAGRTVSFVVVVRNPLDAAKSLHRRDGFELSKGLLLWRSHYLTLLQHLVEYDAPRSFVDYGRFLAEPEQVMARLSRFVNDVERPPPRLIPRIREFVDTFIDPDLSHSESSLEELEQNAAEFPGVVELYRVLSGFAASRWSNEKAEELLKHLDPLAIEVQNYRRQRRYNRLALIRALEERDQQHREHVLHIERDFSADREKSIKDLAVAMSREMRLLSEQKDLRIATVEREKEASITALRSSLDRDRQAIQRHLEGALESIDSIRSSLSYRLGMGLTWPARKLYDGVIAPFRRFPDNRALAGRMLYYVLRHPLKSLRLLNWERIQNLHRTFFRNPGVAGDVVGNYARMLHGEELPERYRRGSAAALPKFDSEGDAAGQKVSIITVNFNGKTHLPGLLDSLAGQDYENFEIVLVDNGSSDGSVEYVRTHYPRVKLVVLKENVGFAEANNIGAEVADGRYWCLVNNDMEAAQNWLSRLVETISSSCEIGAVGPKILFWKRFVRIEMKVTGHGELLLNETELEKHLDAYPKYFFGAEWGQTQENDDQWRSLKGIGQLDLAVCKWQEQPELSLKALRGPLDLEIASVAWDVPLRIKLGTEERKRLALDFSAALAQGKLRYLINNAASDVDEAGNVRDRGFAQPDDGVYDQPQAVTALCGGAMMLRPEALKGKSIFGGEFFAYFEDTDLSLRIREAGFALAYQPDAVIYHKHASTSKENSPFFRFYVNRNRLLFLALHYPQTLWRPQLEEARNHLNHLSASYGRGSASQDERAFGKRIPELLEDLERLIPRILAGRFFDRSPAFRRTAVYNAHWNTLGGGENHAGVIAQALQRFGPVDLISEQDFNMDALQRQFGLSLKFCRKKLVTAERLHHDPQLTGGYELFVNSTFGSDLESYARHSYYVVSFPFRLEGRDRSFLDSYTGFWANSRYTAGWIKQWWGMDSEVLYPSVAIPNVPFDAITKEKRILHVGRFFCSGHNKKQLELVKAFAAMIDSGVLNQDWQLTFVGQVHWEQSDYLDQVRAAAASYPVDIQTDVPLAELQDLYARSAIYWHATGLNEKVSRNPDLFEHFGIATVEAMSLGCVPVVINAGGQPEIVREDRDGFLFADLDELKRYTGECVRLFEQEPERYRQLSQSAYHRARTFSRHEAITSVHRLLGEQHIFAEPQDILVL